MASHQGGERIGSPPPKHNITQQYLPWPCTKRATHKHQHTPQHAQQARTTETHTARAHTGEPAVVVLVGGTCGPRHHQHHQPATKQQSHINAPHSTLHTHASNSTSKNGVGEIWCKTSTSSALSGAPAPPPLGPRCGCMWPGRTGRNLEIV